ncbi:hypothetical protein HFE03_03595 [Paenibacillus sp. EKM102P]|uniref:hypothetical protein n=1 Tax=unclassified Paenibacillus TaxID=185978 RepID=UPI00142D7680|nr:MULTISPECIES: hypothetical protein [unclassified Paenibacillus]KAF6618294.1 hypothetical protein HFE00_09435 [Paenibacillus sp. EKM101P]KAF6624639.1 hypothetical protein HFE03_03595 [Paenibacillus sp. EKM102P]KAF6635582.1 hypothetical protein HFE01_01435 [Paenibacillus sp. EKM10P]KAF6648708.1 hypothetical protein HFE02_10115 [Paenibacillus sp. EKM11P]
MDKKIQEIREWHEREERRIKKYPESKQVRYPNEPSQKAYDIIGYLLQQIEIKDKALEFYEDTSTYTETMEEIQNVFSPKGMPSYRTNSAPIVFDKGERARAALKGEDTP